MGEILGLGMTHYPPLTGPDGDWRTSSARCSGPGLPSATRAPGELPEAMRQQYARTADTASAAAHRERLVQQFRQARALLDDFRPECG